MADLLARDDREKVRLVVIEEAPRRVDDIAPLAPRDGIRNPPEEAAPQLLAGEELQPRDAPHAVLDQAARRNGRLDAAPHDEVVEVFHESRRLERERAREPEGGAEARLDGARERERRCAEDRAEVLGRGRLVIDAAGERPRDAR